MEHVRIINKNLEGIRWHIAVYVQEKSSSTMLAFKFTCLGASALGNGVGNRCPARPCGRRACSDNLQSGSPGAYLTSPFTAQSLHRGAVSTNESGCRLHFVRNSWASETREGSDIPKYLQ
jgi:hypothetical protein